MTKKKTRRKKQAKRKQASNIWILPVFLVLSILTVLGLEYIKYKKSGESAIFTKKKPVKQKKEGPDRPVNKPSAASVKFDDKIQIFFNRDRIQYSHFIDPTWHYHHYKIEIKENRLKALVGNIRALSQTAGGQFSEVEKVEKDLIFLYATRFSGRTTHKFLISGIQKKSIKKPQYTSHKPDKSPKIAFIIDDIGYQNSDANLLKQLNIPITASILPNTPFAGEEGQKLYAFGLESMIHMPMQAKDTSMSYPKDQFVVLSSTMNDIIRLVDHARKIIPHAKGLNNHMGSMITSNREAISKVLTVVKNRGLFFVDSRTTLTTVAGKLSKKAGIKTGEKDIFIDHIKTYKHSMEQIEKLIRVALYKGQAIAIGHPNPTTFRAIKDSVPKIRSKGIKIVFVSQLVK